MSNLRYKDMSVGRSSVMGAAMLESKPDAKLIERLYREGNEQFHREFPRDVWEKVTRKTKKE